MCKPSDWPSDVQALRIIPKNLDGSSSISVCTQQIQSINIFVRDLLVHLYDANITHDPKFVRWNLPLYRIITTFEAFQSRLACFEPSCWLYYL